MATSVVPQDDFLIAVWSIQAMNVSVCPTQSSTDPNRDTVCQWYVLSHYETGNDRPRHCSRSFCSLGKFPLGFSAQLFSLIEGKDL